MLDFCRKTNKQTKPSLCLNTMCLGYHSLANHGPLQRIRSLFTIEVLISQKTSLCQVDTKLVPVREQAEQVQNSAGMGVWQKDTNCFTIRIMYVESFPFFC